MQSLVDFHLYNTQMNMQIKNVQPYLQNFK